MTSSMAECLGCRPALNIHNIMVIKCKLVYSGSTAALLWTAHVKHKSMRVIYPSNKVPTMVQPP